MTELTIDGKTYISSKRAAEITGYAKDYIGQLCREGRVTSKLVGRSWYVLESAIREHRFGKDDPKAVLETRAKLASSTWEAPTYQAEVAQHLPEMPVKAVLNDRSDAGTLTAMHSAWQEWFSLKQATKVPEFEPDRLLADHEEVSIAPAEAPATAMSEEEAVSEPEVVHMTRLEAPEPVMRPVEPPYLPAHDSEREESGYIDSEPVAIPIERIRPAMRPVDVPAPMPAARPATFAATEEALFQEALREDAQGSSPITIALRVVLGIIIIAAIGVGVAGSGVADSFIAKIGAAKYVDVITGSSVYTK